MKLPFQIRLSRPQIILAGFAAMILIGSLLLMLPVSSLAEEGSTNLSERQERTT